VCVEECFIDCSSQCEFYSWTIGGRELWSSRIGGYFYDSFVVFDFFSDIKGKEVVVGVSDKIYLLNGEDGSVLWNYYTEKSIYGSSPSVADINGDGMFDIVIVGFNSEAQRSLVYSFSGKDISLLWAHTFSGLSESSPAVGDINNDGESEIIIWVGGEVYALKGKTGEVVWKQAVDGARSPAIGDVNGDGIPDVVTGNCAIKGDDGSILWWRNGFPSNPAIGDINGDGKMEVVVALDYTQATLIEVLNGENGEALWYKNEGDVYYMSSPAIGDVNGDGKLEVVANFADKFCAFNGEDGKRLWCYNTKNWLVSSPALGDIDHDGRLEVIAGSTDHHLYVVNGEDGSLVFSFRTYEIITSSPILADVNDDGELDIIIGDEMGNIYVLRTYSSIPNSSLLPWPKFKHDIRNTGFYTGNPNPPE
jgi:outer membrane protein assembly factor BamB